MKRPERPDWCGECDQDTRLVVVDDETARRCPRCHAATQPGGRHAPRAALTAVPTIRAPRVVALELSLGDDA